MLRRTALAVTSGLLLAGVATVPASATDLVPAAAREVLPANDGWAASGSGTTGGATAAGDHVYVVRTRAELAAALGGTDTAPRIVLVAGTIRPDGDCASYADPAYSLAGYLAAYDPAVWGRATRPSGPLEEARVRSARNQAADVQLRVPSNTTILGLGNARLRGLNLLISNVDNVIVRNLRLEDAADCFPAWDPTDGSTGNWNSAYDLITLTGATHVWADHNTFSDGDNDDSAQPSHFGRPYQVHDGALDVIRASDLVTISYNVFQEHDKTMLIGSTNTVGADVGKLRVTIHHNRFANVGQRAPRVRFGRIDLYDNYYYATDEDTYSYSWGVGVHSAIHAENNFVLRSADLALDEVVHDWGGTALTEIGTLTRIGTGPVSAVDLLAAYNATHDPDLGADAGWTPTLRPGPLTPTAQVPAVVDARAGAGRLNLAA
ncbi:pectate lyase family protein [Actinoplanes teichomyceticus]|uniref:Pectate lyase n=1 Tax=Actinoplanes teichomyceticus TaxID=1867 RepID=A0A561W9Z7_ACTTI|nr:pectate lyase [Actinoplanes teichomyceticus]TWG20679.1 pectate lyase [Actinoplanes teichomyceticus]GIF14333.1 pectate lyase [Actinoplanes teichomyceticus]